MIDQVLFVAVVVLAVWLCLEVVFRGGFRQGHKQGYFDAMKMVTEAAEAQAEREVEEQRALLRRMQDVNAEETAIERHAAGVARWN